MKYTFLIFVLLQGLNIVAQTTWKDCVYERNLVDEFKGFKIKETQSNRLFMSFSEGSFISFLKIDSNYFIQIERSCPKVMSVSENDELLIKLKNDSILTLLNYEYTITESISGRVGNNIITNHMIYTKYPVTKKQLQEIRNYGIKKYRLYTTKSYFEDEVENKRLESINLAIDCILL